MPAQREGCHPEVVGSGLTLATLTTSVSFFRVAEMVQYGDLIRLFGGNTGDKLPPADIFSAEVILTFARQLTGVPPPRLPARQLPHVNHVTTRLAGYRDY